MNLGAVSTLVFDLDGVVWRGDTPIDSAIKAINDLRAAGKRCLFCTNNSSQTQAAFVAKLAGMGVEGVVEEDFITSSSATALYLSAQYTGPFLAYVVGGEGIRQAIQRIGARIVPDSDITEDTNVDCVVAGIDREFNYAKLDTAQRLIRRGALFVATNRDATYPTEDGVVPGAGAIVSAIETAGGSTPVTIGKPRPVMLQLVLQKYGLKPEQVAFIGDRLDTDVVCARRAGVAALLVTTGVTTLQQARRAKGEMRPDAVFPDLTSFAEVVLENSPAEPLNNDELPTITEAIAAAPFAAVTEEIIPESSPPVVEAPAEVEVEMEAPVETAGTIEAVEPVAPVVPEELSAFSFDTAMAKESEATTAANGEKDAEWNENWFEENAEEGDATGETTVVLEDTPAEGDKPPAPDAPAGDDAFNWKLD